MLKGNMYSNILLLLTLKNSKIFCGVEQKKMKGFLIIKSINYAATKFK